MDKFLKIQNFQACNSAFKKWMWDNFQVTVDEVTDIDCDKSLFAVMKNVKNEFVGDSDMSVKDLNNISLNKLQDIYVARLNLSKKKAPPTSLDRDASLYGNRPVTSSMVPLPTNTTNRDEDDVNKQLELMMASRGGGGSDVVPSVPIPSNAPTIETAIPEDTFEKLLSTARDEYSQLKNNIEIQRPLIPENTQILYQTPHDHRVNDIVPAFSPYQVQETLSGQSTNMQNALIQSPVKRHEVFKYAVINGFDKDWKIAPKRYNFSIDLSDFSNKYKNVTFLQFPKLIIPNEIIESRTLINQPKFVYNNDQKLAYPYLLLKVDEISDLCDGVSKQIQNSFAQMIHYDSYRCPNGRGYIILEPAQNERKVYGPQNLATLQRLTFSIQKPNGTLFNNAIDDYNIVKVEYQCYNSLYLQVVLDKFFDKNEFYIGDTINISNYTVYKPPSAGPELQQQDFNGIMDFVNRPEGHEIIQLGDANDNGFYKTFHILAPGSLDQTVGKLTVNKAQVDALREYNIVTIPKVNGCLINISLQITLSMTIGTNVGDVSILSLTPV